MPEKRNKGRKESMIDKRNKGCIKTTKGPWIVHRTTKDGSAVTRYRFPTERERQNNRQRECKRRSLTQKIFAGLRAHGNYQLPKHPDTNNLLKALCEEAGWHVEEDGTIYRRKEVISQMPNFIRPQQQFDVDLEKNEYCQCISKMHGNNYLEGYIEKHNNNINLDLSL